MQHLKEAKEFMEKGEVEKASTILENVLFLGPSNVEALKIRAHILAMKGHFDEETKIWQKIARIDDEDEEVAFYFEKKSQEEREKFYFTDYFPGGRRFLGNPRGLVASSFFGIAGCLAFLFVGYVSQNYPILKHPVVAPLFFIALIVTPWICLSYFFFKSLQEIQISTGGFLAKTRVKSVFYAWRDIDRICITYDEKLKKNQLSLIIVPKDQTRAIIEVDIGENTSQVRARTYLIDEIRAHFGEPLHASSTVELSKHHQPLLRF